MHQQFVVTGSGEGCVCVCGGCSVNIFGYKCMHCKSVSSFDSCALRLHSDTDNTDLNLHMFLGSVFALFLTQYFG